MKTQLQWLSALKRRGFFKKSVIYVITFCSSILAAHLSQSQAPPIGAGLDGIADYSKSRWFVDIAKGSRIFGYADSSYVRYQGPKATDGWPMNDFGLYMLSGMDPVHEPFLYGTYKLSFTGRATPDVRGGATLQNLVYNSNTNVTTADVILNAASNPYAIDIAFRNQQGIRNIHLISPGYDPNNYPLIRNEMAAIIKKFSTLRMMDWLNTNYSTVSTWAERSQPTMPGDMNIYGNTAGVPWEDIITVANTYNKDIWINIPAQADDNYIQQLATLMHQRLNPGIKVYIELANEVWNSGTFPAYHQLNDIAKAEVAAGDPDLNYDNVGYDVIWTERKIAKRLYQISNYFKAAFGAAAINTTIRPVLAGQIYQGFYSVGLEFATARFGPVKDYFYGAAIAPYFSMANDSDPNTYTKDQILTQLDNSVTNLFSQRQMDLFVGNTIKYGIKPLAYEAGPDTYGKKNIQAKADATNDPRMRTITNRFLNLWYSSGGDLLNWFVIGTGGNYDSEYGSWQLIGWPLDTNSAQKYLGIKDVLAAPKPAITSGLILPVTIQATQTIGYDDNYASRTIYLASGDKLEYLVNAPADGTYSFNISNSQNDANSRGSLWEGSTQLGGQLNLSTSPSNTITFSLTKGLHVLRFQSDIAPTYKLVPTTINFGNGSNVAVTSVNIAPTSISVASGATSQLSATISPSNASNQNVSWASSNTSIATVNSSGLVTGIAAGNANITVTTQDGNKTDVCSVTVTSNSSGTNLALNKPATATSDQSANPIASGNDGNGSTRWAASAGTFPQTYSIDLGSASSLTSVQIDWELSANKYQYRIETSPDNSNWNVQVDKTGNTTAGNTSDNLSVSNVRYIRVVITNVISGGVAWASFYEIRVLGTAGAGDTQAPTVPTGLSSSNISQTSFTLSWTASTDNVGVASYDVYNGSSLAGNTASTSFNVTGLTAATSYSFTVKAKDAANNISAASSALSVTTSPNSGGTNLALNKSATATSAETSNPIANGNDGSSSTRWAASSGSFPQTYSIDLGNASNLTSVQVDWETIANKYQYRIETSVDNVNWTIQVDKTGNTSAGNTSDNLSVSNVRYIRVVVTNVVAGGPAWASFYEIRVYGTVGNVPTLVVTTRGDNAANGEGTAQLTDGNVNTKWLDFSATSWIQFTYATGQTWNSYTLTSANDVPARDPKNWNLQGSNDGGSTWTPLDNQSNQSWSSRFLANTYHFTNATAYKIYRLNITANNGDAIIQLAEMSFANGARIGTDSPSDGINNSVTLFPNPASQKVNIGLPSDADATIQIFDMLGKVQRNYATSSTSSATLELENISSGVYFVKTTQAGQSFVSKLIIE